MRTDPERTTGRTTGRVEVVRMAPIARVTASTPSG